MRMPQIMVEAFAKGLIDKIMLEAFDTMDPNDEPLSKKLRMLGDREEPADTQSQSTHASLQIQDSETTELIEKMVCGLRNLQIGDSTCVPSLLSNLEKQVKHVVCTIDSVSTAEAPKAAEMTVTQGQGDVHQIIHNAVIETPTDPSYARKEKEIHDSNEITRVSVSLLHRMIEELETKGDEAIDLDQNESDSVRQEGIAAWEETEEQFIRTIESVDEEGNVAFPSESSSNDNDHDEQLSTLCLVHDNCLEEVVVEEITSSPLPGLSSSEIELDERNSFCSVMNSQHRKKKGMFHRIRKMWRRAFGCRRN
ncbi:uncharacterized protein LOC128890046 [Hylaeus anthracinus]|uniref:uncharacterized protein LOC128890046 n=1 Tax=Hylaeus anthracinus TaxID=313031 RepID=UPI0023BA344C|nr:uncharacterized protein LOC128890046 [Hylaeus anthracinus]